MEPTNENTIGQIFQLSNKLHSIVQKNNGAVTLHFFNGATVSANFLNLNINIQYSKAEASITTFNTNIEKTEMHNLFLVKDVS